jgi:hypothetical protein
MISCSHGSTWAKRLRDHHSVHGPTINSRPVSMK